MKIENTPTIQIRVDVIGMPHTFLSVTHPDGRRIEYGLIPAVDGAPYTLGKIDITGIDSIVKKNHQSNAELDGPTQPLSVAQYRKLMEAINRSIANPPQYSVVGVNGENCTHWAVRMWRASGAPEEHGFSMMESVGNPYWQSVWRDIHNDLDKIRKLRYYGVSKLRWRWSKEAEGCLKVGLYGICVDTSKPPPKLRNPPPPPQDAKPKPKRKDTDPTINFINDIGAVINAASRFKQWLDTPSPPKPPKEKSEKQVAEKQKALEPFDILDIPDVMESKGLFLGAKLLRKQTPGMLSAP